MLNDYSTAVLLLGSNIGDRITHLSEAINLIETRAGSVMFASGLYETAAWGKTDQPSFLNQAIIIQTPQDAFTFLQTTLQIEKELGRTREVKWGQRTLDIDIIYYNDNIIATPELKIPHPGIPERKFVLVPLCELMPGFIHPVLNVSNETLLQRCTDTLDVKSLTFKI